MESVIPPFGKAEISRNWQQTEDRSSPISSTHRFTMDTDEFFPSPDQDPIDKTRHAKP